MKDAFVDFVRELQGTVRARRQEKIQEVELAWSASELAGFRLFVMGLHPATMADVCHALSDAQATPLLEILGDFAEKEPELMKIAFQSMEKTSCLARIFLAKRLILSQKPEVRAKTCEMLGNAGPQAQPLLKQALADDDPRVQQAAIHAVSRAAFKNLCPLLCPLLRSKDGNVRFAVLKALALFGFDSPALNNDLLAILQDTAQDEQARRLAAKILASASSKEARAVLLNALYNPGAEYTLRMAAVESLSGYDDPEAIKAVLCAVDDPNINISRTARISLSRKHSQAFAGILAQNLGDADIRIAALAAEILGELDTDFIRDILLSRLKVERRIPIINALALAMSKSSIPGAWHALIARFQEEKIASPAFFSALADIAEEDNLEEFASLFDKVSDAAVRRVIMERLALFARTSPVTPAIESLAMRVLNEPDQTLHLSAATILAHVASLDAQKIAWVLEHLASAGENPDIARAVSAILRNKNGSLSDAFMHASPATAGLLAQAAAKAACAGEKAIPLFHTVAGWARRAVPHAKDALQAMALLAPSALAIAMSGCPDQIYLIEAWRSLPNQDRSSNRPDFQTFFAGATLEDTLAGIHILKTIQDSRCLNDMANVAFTSRYPEARQAALAFTRELILAP